MGLTISRSIFEAHSGRLLGLLLTTGRVVAFCFTLAIDAGGKV